MISLPIASESRHAICSIDCITVSEPGVDHRIGFINSLGQFFFLMLMSTHYVVGRFYLRTSRTRIGFFSSPVHFFFLVLMPCLSSLAVLLLASVPEPLVERHNLSACLLGSKLINFAAAARRS